MAAELGLIYRVSSIFHYFLFEWNLDFLYLNLLTHFLAQFDTTDKLPNFSNFFERELKNFWDFDLGCNWKIRDTKTFKRTIFLQKKIRVKTLCNFQIVSSFVANRVNHSDLGISTFGQFSNKERLKLNVPILRFFTQKGGIKLRWKILLWPSLVPVGNLLGYHREEFSPMESFRF